MTYTPTQLEVIKTFGRKELSKGLIIWKERISEIIAIDYEREGFYRMIDDGENVFSGSIKGAEILGHIPHLEDVFSLMTQKMFYWSYRKVYEIEGYSFDKGWEIDVWDSSNLWHIPYNPTISLLEQPESVLIELLTKIKG